MSVAPTPPIGGAPLTTVDPPHAPFAPEAPDGSGPGVDVPADADAPELIPLLAPRDGDVLPITDPVEVMEWARRLAAGGGPVALDAERASGYRYSARAYLVQLRRDDVGTALFDPAALGDLAVLDDALADAEWVLHAASQDLPCLIELGMRPRTLFDTELAGRLAGLPRVGLGPLVEQMLGLHLRKGHGAADWSTRPLPREWLTYAALDVEVLVELRDAMDALLTRQGKSEWARQEFAAIVAAPPSPPRVDPWRRTSGIHRLHDRRALAVIRELWLARDSLARRRDLAPHRVLPDTAIIAAATAKPTTEAALVALPVFSGRMQRRTSALWAAAVARGLALPEDRLPTVRLVVDGPPAPARWSAKDPVAAARLAAARTRMAALSERVSVPVENLVSPDLLRRVLWSPPDDGDVATALSGLGARPWQVELVSPEVRGALSDAATAPVATPSEG
ncbi:ribonuclease D [Nakamurella flavida]|uniref:Ribonuclease D n=1 Tax=Nakamurella flavida TaxID=363630 RepID=A0A939C3A7_9ACTN|nr:ribonuclease D [Nakamurella flavida]MBM9477435.1 ribonuclease D [Nakamurella flavida]MDP9777368.1 ribonuclease D [Nakamurella flavida]